MRAKKSLGQHFLRSEKALLQIIDAGDPNANNLILEIGPGQGVLTEKLLKFAGKVIAVEKDNELFKSLGERFREEIQKGKLDLIHADILEFDPNVLKFYKELDYKLIANIPYNITGAILEKFLSADHQPKLMVLLVQKEVAERVCGHGVSTRVKESILSISVKAYGKPRLIDTVKAGSFVPMPKVDSAIISIEDISKGFFQNFPTSSAQGYGGSREKEFFRLLKAGFQAKRKKLSSNLSIIYPKEKVLGAFQTLNLNENVRAEDIPLETWGKLAKNLI
ncbi:MAG: 16S rRNA (adenine(1518)-N(6)/adenine(1519)-N(6))-dimethyltransferase RsmA [Patescibacteria group bacterium]|mgnify:CR=1 FL=1